MSMVLDLLGGVLSFSQLAYDGWGRASFTEMLMGNLGKIGLGLISVVFDVVFLVQHYLLYPAGAPALAYHPILD